MRSNVDTKLRAVPEVTLECYIQQSNGVGMTRVRLEGSRSELQYMLQEFQRIVMENQYAQAYDYDIENPLG